MIKPAQAGDLVVSCAGRDKGGVFVVLKAEEPFLFLADGRSRTLLKPKKKKRMHLKKYPSAADVSMDVSEEKGRLCDADIRKHIAAVLESRKTGKDQ